MSPLYFDQQLEPRQHVEYFVATENFYGFLCASLWNWSPKALSVPDKVFKEWRHLQISMLPRDETPKILEELAQFTGTERYHRSGLGGLLLTDGAHHLRERLDCYWLIDVVESYQPVLSQHQFQLWSIDVRQDSSAVVEMREDTGLEPLVSQDISYTDFALPRYEFYCVVGVVMLKSEY